MLFINCIRYELMNESVKCYNETKQTNFSSNFINLENNWANRASPQVAHIRQNCSILEMHLLKVPRPVIRHVNTGAHRINAKAPHGNIGRRSQQLVPLSGLHRRPLVNDRLHQAVSRHPSVPRVDNLRLSQDKSSVNV